MSIREQFVGELRDSADLYSDESIRRTVLRHAYENTLPTGKEPSDHIDQMDPASVTDQAVFRNAILRTKKAWKVPDVPVSLEKRISTHVEIRNHLAELIAHCDDPACKELAELLALPGRGTPQTSVTGDFTYEEINDLAHKEWIRENKPEGRNLVHWDTAKNIAAVTRLARIQSVFQQSFGMSHLLHFEEVLDSAESGPMQRQAMSSAFQKWMLECDRETVYSIIQSGFNTISQIRTVPKTAWRIRGDGTEKNGEPGPYRKNMPLLKNVLGTERQRARLGNLDGYKNLRVRDGIERGITYEAQGEVLKYPYNYTMPYYEGNTPRCMTEQRFVSCFSGPWIIASMLIESGIPAERIFFCDDVYYPGATYYGGHASLLVISCNNKTILLDTGHCETNEETHVKHVHEQDRDRYESLLLRKTREPAHVYFKPEAQKSSQLPATMTAMPILEGFASQHMFNTGLYFSHQRKPVHAQYAYELGLSLNPQNTYMLAMHGLVLFEQGQFEQAKQSLQETLRLRPDHPFANFFLGELALEEGDPKKARTHFHVVMGVNQIFGDKNKLQKQAATYLAEEDSAMISLWKEKQKSKPNTTEEPAES